MIFLLLLASLFSLAARVFLVLAVYYDADSKGIKDKNIYAVLTLFFPIIMIIVYLCVRKNAAKIQPKMCNVCHTTVNTNMTFCPKCLSSSFTDYLVAGSVKKKKQSNLFSVMALLFYICAVINIFTACSVLVQDFDDYINDDSYSYNEHYFDDYDYSDKFNIEEFEKNFDDYNYDGETTTEINPD